ncbi:hypothetical protein UFOVP225_30 [uncultured Caudovirales phage]|uniref:Uncharacterized protein n=1 Tax=uncultured Caudovirales phage TaxID=2100421 RepID=A0A6J7WMR3_9CAUD|nr:hypothetical protein UFOVP113_43 [uncultured Caudovirales phage]CAB5219146.1 hypothetical protein UFOVP225_30 [uncultured Caudovirales phage]
MARLFKTPITSEGKLTSVGVETSGSIIITGANSPIVLGGTSHGTAGQVLTSQGTAVTPIWTTPSGSGTVTSASVVSANGFAGTVATATTTPAITLSTTITGVLKGNGTAISAATAGTDYMSPTGGTFTGAVTVTGGFTSSSSSSTLNSITYFGTSSASHIVQEQVTTVGTGFAGYSWNIGTTSNIVYITANSTANGTLALVWTGPSINTAVATGSSWTGTILITNGATPFYINAMTIDGTAQTIKWSQGVAPTAGNANSVDAYTFVLIKTANLTYTVLGTFAKFA